MEKAKYPQGTKHQAYYFVDKETGCVYLVCFTCHKSTKQEHKAL